VLNIDQPPALRAGLVKKESDYTRFYGFGWSNKACCIVLLTLKVSQFDGSSLPGGPALPGGRRGRAGAEGGLRGDLVEADLALGLAQRVLTHALVRTKVCPGDLGRAVVTGGQVTGAWCMVSREWSL
jgi:hypothetical protein